MSRDDDHLFYKRKRWTELRQVILLRDNFRCVICGADCRGKRQAVIDHIKPRSTHPDFELAIDNLRTLCPACHNQGHIEKHSTNSGNGERIERFRPKGCDADGWPPELSR